MTRDLAVNLLAAGMAFLAGIIARSAWHRMSRRRKLRDTASTRLRRHPRYTAGWLTAYYVRHGAEGDLFRFESGGREMLVPFLTRPEWRCDGRSEESLLVQRTPQVRSTAPVVRSVLQRRGGYLDGVTGDEEWNDLIAGVAGVDPGPDGPRIRVMLAEYYQFLSSCGALEDETYAAVRRRFRRTPLRDRTLSDADRAAESLLGAPALGMQVAFVFEVDGRPRILVQRRSHSVSIYGGALAVVPVFGCQTLDLTDRTPVSLFHNFLREVYEELYGGIEVERRGGRVEPRWFYREPPIARLLEAQEAGLFEFRLLGFGYDALNGEMDLCGLARMTDAGFGERELAEMSSNWEIQDIQVWDLYGPELTDALLAGEFSPGSVYTIALARELLGARAAGDA